MRHFLRKGLGRFFCCWAMVVVYVLCRPEACNAAVGINPPPPPPPPTPTPDFTIALFASPAGAGSVWAPSFFGMSNDTARVIAEPRPWMVFDYWSENGALVSTQANYIFQLTSNRSLVGNFSPLYPGKCTVSLAASPPGAGAVLMPWHDAEYYITEPAWVDLWYAANGFAFFNWTIDGVAAGNSTDLRFNVTSNCT